MPTKLRKCPKHRCWVWATTCEHKVKLKVVRDGKTGWECDKCDAFWSDDFLESHPNGKHEFTRQNGDWLTCTYCNLERSRRPLIYV